MLTARQSSRPVSLNLKMLLNLRSKFPIGVLKIKSHFNAISIGLSVFI